MKGERPFIHLSKIFDGFRFNEPIALVGKILCYAIKLSALLFIADIGSDSEPQTRSPIIWVAKSLSISLGEDLSANQGIISTSKSLLITAIILFRCSFRADSSIFAGNFPHSSDVITDLGISERPTNLSRANGGVVAIRRIVIASGTDFNMSVDNRLKQSFSGKHCSLCWWHLDGRWYR